MYHHIIFCLFSNIINYRIDKDVQRCDRNHPYFTLANLEKLRNIITTYVWENLDVGYMQVMCLNYILMSIVSLFKFF